jgi:hypothetical protein
MTSHVVALQQARPDQPAGSCELTVHSLPRGPPHATPPVHAESAHVTVLRADLASIAPEQDRAPHVTVHESAALHEMAPEHEPMPQSTLHAVPPQAMSPEHEASPQRMSQLAACVQSIEPLQPLRPH